MKGSNVLLLIAILAFSFSTAANDWSQKVTVKEVIAGYKQRIIMFSTHQTHHNPKECEPSYYTINDTDADLEVMLAILLAAQRSGAHIQVGVDSSKCGSISHANGRINVTRLKAL